VSTTVEAIKERYGLTDEEARRFALLILVRQSGPPRAESLSLDFIGQRYAFRTLTP
jgi:hypothetical protein